jgi:hypothetical protein
MLAYRFVWVALLITAMSGCSKPLPPVRVHRDQEPLVRQVFAGLQAAVKGGDAEKLWTLLTSESQADADHAAQAIRDDYAHAGSEQKARDEKELGLAGAELAGLTGKGFLKTMRFRRKLQDLPGSVIDQVVIEGDNATVHYTEPDGDKEKAIFIRQDRHWKAWVVMPKTSR